MSTRASLNLMASSYRQTHALRNAETQRMIRETNLRRWDQQFQMLREHQQAAINYKPYTPNTPLIQPVMTGSLDVDAARPWIVLGSTASAGFGAFLITACITTDVCPMLIVGGSSAGCVCLICTAYQVNDYYQRKPFVLQTQNRREEPREADPLFLLLEKRNQPQKSKETNSWSWLSFEECGV